eukprot:929603-Prorocentrum_minimum.AAC.3
MADTSAKGQQQSFTLMLNYMYNLSEIEANHENFARAKAVRASDEVTALAKEAEKRLGVHA